MHVHCGRCRFFHPNPPASKPEVVVFSADSVRGGGECRRKNPSWRQHDVACFPLVAGDWWCGDFEAKQAHGNPDGDAGPEAGPRPECRKCADCGTYES